MFLDLIDFSKLRKALLHGLLILTVLLFQNIILARVGLFGVRAMFVPAAAVAVGLFEGSVWGGVFGVFLGALCDVAFPDSTVLFTLLFPCFGFFSGMLTDYLMNKRFFPYLVLCLAACALTAFGQMFGLLVFDRADPGLLFRVGLTQTLWSMPFAACIYLPFRAIARRNAARDLRQG